MILMMVVTVIMIGFDLFAVIMVMIKEGSNKRFHLTTHSTHFTVIWCLTYGKRQFS